MTVIRLVVSWRIGEMFDHLMSTNTIKLFVEASTSRNKTNQYEIGDEEMICANTTKDSLNSITIDKDVSTLYSISIPGVTSFNFSSTQILEMANHFSICHPQTRLTLVGNTILITCLLNHIMNVCIVCMAD